MAGEIEVFAGEGMEADGAEGFAVVAVEHGTLGFQSGGGLQQGASLEVVALFDLDEAEAEPRVGQAGIDCNGGLKICLGRAEAVVGAMEKSGKRVCLSVAWRGLQGAGERLVCGWDSTRRKLEFSDAGPCEAGIGEKLGGAACGVECFGELETGLEEIALGNEMGGGFGGGAVVLCWGFLVEDSGEELFEGAACRVRGGGFFECVAGLFDAAGSEKHSGVVEASGNGLVGEMARMLVECGEEVALLVGSEGGGEYVFFLRRKP